jgi:carbonic anhydrase
MPDELLERLRRLRNDAFPTQRSLFLQLVDHGQQRVTLFIGCSDSRLMPHLLTGAGPGEMFLVRKVGALVPPYDQSQGFHGTAAAIEYGMPNLSVKRVEARALSLHGAHCVLEEGEAHLFDVQSGRSVPASVAEHSGTGRFRFEEPTRIPDARGRPT